MIGLNRFFIPSISSEARRLVRMAAPKSPLVLVADDDRAIQDWTKHHVEQWNYRVASAITKAELYRRLSEEEPSILLLDLCFGEYDGTEILQEVLRRNPEMVVVMFTGEGTISNAVNTIKLGAFEYITKPVEPHRLKMVLDDGMEKRNSPNKDVREFKATTAGERTWGPSNESSQNENTDSHSETSGEASGRKGRSAHESLLLGKSRAIREVREQIATVAPTDATVLILGESGTGKELVAREVHQLNVRRDGPFVPVNMAALPRELAESTLFGHIKGAFTGADQSQIGCCEAAHGGTLFLDEIGEMEHRLQGKLLRFLQERTVQRVGSSTVNAVNVRVVAATNRDLLARVNSGEFRRDLYYRLNVVPIELPPLRDRREDVPLLANRFLQRFSQKYSKPMASFSDEAMQVLVRCLWPGNVRQLENLVERLVILSQTPTIIAEALPAEVYETATSDLGSGVGTFSPPPQPPLPLQGETTIGVQPLKELEKQAIIQALYQTKGNVREAAKLLGKGQATVYRKIKEHGIVLEELGRTPQTED